MNKVVLMGRLTRDPKYDILGRAKATAVRYTLAVERRFQREGAQTARFIPCVVFGKSAEFADSSSVRDYGFGFRRIQTGSYMNKDGIKVYTTIGSRRAGICESKSEQGRGNQGAMEHRT